MSTNPEIQTAFVTAGEMRFEVHQCGDAASPRLALCLHGFPEHAYSWRHQLPLLARLGYKAWAPNQRGYGASSRPKGARSYALDLLVEDAARLIDAADCESVTLIGHDWGGMVAWMSALKAVRPIDKLVVMNLPHPTRFVEHARGLRQLKRSWYIFFFQLPWLPEFAMTRNDAQLVGQAFRGMAIDKSRFPDEVLEVYRRNALQPGAATAMINWYRAVRYSSMGPGEFAELPPLEIPTLMIWGEHDTALGVELTYRTDELVKDFTIRYLPDVSHWVQQEAPEEVNAMLEAWLRGESVPGNAFSSEQRGSAA